MIAALYMLYFNTISEDRSSVQSYEEAGTLFSPHLAYKSETIYVFAVVICGHIKRQSKKWNLFF